MHNFLIIDDHVLFSNGLKQIIERNISSTIKTINNPLHALELNFNEYDLVFVDMDMPQLRGLELISKIIERGEVTNYIVISMHNKPSLIKKANQLGVLGYMLKDDNVEDIISAIHSVLNKKIFLSPKINANILSNDMKKAHISPREEEVLRYIAMGKTMKEIGKLLHISPDTAITHSKKIKLKLQINSKAGLIKYAVENLLV